MIYCHGLKAVVSGFASYDYDLKAVVSGFACYDHDLQTMVDGFVSYNHGLQAVVDRSHMIRALALYSPINITKTHIDI